MERVMGIEPTPSAWEAEVLPLNYTRVRASAVLGRGYGDSKRILAAWRSRGRKRGLRHEPCGKSREHGLPTEQQRARSRRAELIDVLRSVALERRIQLERRVLRIGSVLFQRKSKRLVAS